MPSCSKRTDRERGGRDSNSHSRYISKYNVNSHFMTDTNYIYILWLEQPPSSQFQIFNILGAFAKRRKSTLSPVISVALSFCRYVSLYVSPYVCPFVSHYKDFHEIWYFSIFRKFVQKNQISIKYDKNNRYFTRIPIYIYYSSLNSS